MAESLFFSASSLFYVLNFIVMDGFNQVLARGVECDIALLSVESEEFWKGAEPLHFGHLPRLQVILIYHFS